MKIEEIKLKNYLNEIFIFCIKNNSLLGVKICLLFGANIHYKYDYAIKCSSDLSYTKIIKYLINKGIDIHFHNDFIVKVSVTNENIELVKYLVKNGADISKIPDYALKYLVENKSLTMISYLLLNGFHISDFEKIKGFDKIKNKLRYLKIKNVINS